jgi:hypothetical protein
MTSRARGVNNFFARRGCSSLGANASQSGESAPPAAHLVAMSAARCSLIYFFEGTEMHEIVCPHCGKTFKVDEADYASIVSQVRTREFQDELHERIEAAEKEQTAALELAATKAASSLKDATTAKDSEIAKLKSTIDAAEAAKSLAIAEQANTKDAEIAKLQSKIASSELAAKVALREALAPVEKNRDDLAHDLKSKESEFKLRETAQKQQFETQLKDRDDTIDRLKDMKAKLSTKMLGETLEEHCSIAFEQLRATAFQQATFGKDNDSSSGSKGDFIFRDKDADDVEYISIMFEMKNESDTTATRKKNEDFLKELDKDRNEKGCEYAVLVSLLEGDSELYNAGIYDASHIYQKMYVVRPQFFIPIITLLRNAAQSTMQIRAELARVQEQNVDITNFEVSLQKFKKAFSYSFGNASTQFDEAIYRIDEAIKDLEKTKEALRKSLGHLSAASNKADNVSIRQLTRGNPTMAAKFAELERAGAEEPNE